MSTHKETVAIITRHDVPNYGSFLQALATQRIMEELSLNPTIIDYKRQDDATNALIRQYSKSHKNPLYYIYYNTLWRYSHTHIGHVLGNERKKYFHCSAPIYKDSFADKIGTYDLYLTGSDQVWNTVGSGDTREIDGAFFWEGLPKSARIISYAASFGDSDLCEEDFNKCRKWLEKFDCISVREDSGVRLLNEMGFPSTQVLDPTMIVDRKYWNDISDTSRYRAKGKYALIYNLHSDSDMTEYVTRDLRDSDLKIISITTTFRKNAGKNVFCPPIQDFLWLFRNASCIYADSFHAIAFSIIFNTPIVVTLPKRYSTRLESILKLFEMENCLADRKTVKAWEENYIDWRHVNNILEMEKNKSKEWLKQAIKIST